MPSAEKLSEFSAWCQQHVTGDEISHAQIFLDRLFPAFGQPGCLDVGGQTEFRIYDFDTDLDTPKDTLALKDLPERRQTAERKTLTTPSEVCNN